MLRATRTVTMYEQGRMRACGAKASPRNLGKRVKDSDDLSVVRQQVLVRVGKRRRGALDRFKRRVQLLVRRRRCRVHGSFWREKGLIASPDFGRLFMCSR